MSSATASSPPKSSSSRAGKQVVNAFSVDVEDYYQVLNFQKGLPREQWPAMESRVERNTDLILEVMAERGVKGTFFCLGLVAKQSPELIRRIAEAGHEVASHGWSHTPLTKLEPESFREELRSSKALLEDLSSQRVVGFRAPSFSITQKTQWGLDALIDEGYEYDSSIFPVRHPDYGIPGSEEGIHQIQAPSGRSILEFPMTVARFMGRTVPVSGGGYFRLLPYGITRWGLKQANRAGRPAVFYLHPWEVDPEQPNLRAHTSRLGAFRHYSGLHKTENRLRKLLQTFAFTAVRDVLQNAGAFPVDSPS